MLVKRFGSAITRKRKYLKYREKHAQKLEQGLDKVEKKLSETHSACEITIIRTSVFSETIATQYQEQNISIDDNVSDTEMSQTSYASSLRFGRPITISALFKESFERLPFQCPYCFFFITVKGTHSWHKHMFQDIQPYICVANSCVNSDKLYFTKHE